MKPNACSPSAVDLHGRLRGYCTFLHLTSDLLSPVMNYPVLPEATVISQISVALGFLFTVQRSVLVTEQQT